MYLHLSSWTIFCRPATCLTTNNEIPSTTIVIFIIISFTLFTYVRILYYYSRFKLNSAIWPIECHCLFVYECMQEFPMTLEKYWYNAPRKNKCGGAYFWDWAAQSSTWSPPILLFLLPPFISVTSSAGGKLSGGKENILIPSPLQALLQCVWACLVDESKCVTLTRQERRRRVIIHHLCLETHSCLVLGLKVFCVSCLLLIAIVHDMKKSTTNCVHVSFLMLDPI